MTIRLILLHFVLSLLVWPSPGVCADDQIADETRIASFFKSHCTRCHGPETPKADLSLHDLVLNPASDREWQQWDLILDMLEIRAMPPEDEPQPASAERQLVVHWMKSRFRDSLAASTDGQPEPVVRRLTNFEYQNTVRDLLGFELHLARYLPDDPAKPYRFNNTPEYLLMGAEQLERYEENASRAMEAAIVELPVPRVHTARGEWKSPDNELAVDGNRRDSPAAGLSMKSWPAHGEYRIRIKAAAVFPEGTTEMPLRLVMGYSLDGSIGTAPFEPVGTIRLVKHDSEPRLYEFRGRIENHPWEPERKYRRGGTRTGNLVTVPASMVITPQNLFDDGRLNDKIDPQTQPRAVIESIEFEGPLTETWPPEHHTRILFESPLKHSDPDAYVRTVLERFLARAFRRPVRESEIDRYAQIYKINATQDTTFEQAMRNTLAVALHSPSFLYHIPASDEAGRHYEIANRLSYFMWGSMPDSTLFDLAAAQRLDDPEVIQSQVHRMLADPRAQDFIRSFATQWLGLEKCRTIPINLKLFPRFLHTVERGERAGAEVPYRPTIRDDMVAETVAFLSELILRNESLLQIVDSDFAMLNERLAAHYGIAGVQGHSLRRVSLPPDSRLGGVLTQASILTGTGTGSAPNPIYRAVWLREAILGDEVKDPPADVPALEQSAGNAVETATNIRELLRQHRQKTSCNDCHARLDPWGIPFEQYNTIGQYQPMVPPEGTRVRGFDVKRDGDLAGYKAYLQKISTVEVIANSQLPAGPEVSGMDDLKQYLLTHRQDQIVRNVVRRLLSYSLGRRLSHQDRPEVERLVENSRRTDHRMQDLIVAICQSELFLRREPK